MVPQMDDSSIQKALRGLEDDPARSCGIVSCRLQQTKVYDHLRHFAERKAKEEAEKKAKEEKQAKEEQEGASQSRAPPPASASSSSQSRYNDEEDMLFMWDFVFTLEDGREVSVHPEWAQTRFPAYKGVRREDRTIPRTGKGGTSGRGTYKRMKDRQKDATLKFDGSKALRGKGSSSGQAKGSKSGKGRRSK